MHIHCHQVNPARECELYCNINASLHPVKNRSLTACTVLFINAAQTSSRVGNFFSLRRQTGSILQTAEHPELTLPSNGAKQNRLMITGQLQLLSLWFWLLFFFFFSFLNQKETHVKAWRRQSHAFPSFLKPTNA